MIFIGGCPRSGTTLLRELLGRHSRLAIGPDWGFFHQRPKVDRLAVLWDLPEDQVADILRASLSLPSFIDAMAQLRLGSQGKARFVEKTPINCRFVPQILNYFPNARFIHIIRDGRDVAASLRHYGGGDIRSGRVVKIMGNGNVRHAAQMWVSEVSLGLATRGHPRCLEVRYEDLLADPEAELTNICAFVGETFESVMLEPTPVTPSELAHPRFLWNPNAADAIDPSRRGRWRHDLSHLEKREIRHAAGALLIALGYAKDEHWVEE